MSVLAGTGFHMGRCLFVLGVTSIAASLASLAKPGVGTRVSIHTHVYSHDAADLSCVWLVDWPPVACNLPQCKSVLAVRLLLP